MWRKIVRRLLFTVITLIGVSIIAFALPRLAGGDLARELLPGTATEEEIQAKRVEMGLDKPYIEQYVIYMRGILRGDFGYSHQYRMDVGPLMWVRFINSAKLTILTFIFGNLIAIPLGLIAGTHKGSWIDSLVMFIALVGQACPQVWFCLLLILFFAVELGWFPVQGVGGLKYMALPCLSGLLNQASGNTRMLRSGMIDTLDEDYVTATRARGVTWNKIYTKYALKNVMLPIITGLGSSIGAMVGGSVIVESIFGWPGIGQLLVAAVGVRDYQLVQSILLFQAAIMVIGVLATDILYTVVDKRIEFN
ncbi:MAG: ABC transporter permease [Clostridiales bacterium]|nr:ABC transporter permease [Clostridiales bacterium]